MVREPKIDGFAHSGAGSMGEYINNGLVDMGISLPVALGFLGAALSLAGGLISGRPPAMARTGPSSS